MNNQQKPSLKKAHPHCLDRVGISLGEPPGETQTFFLLTLHAQWRDSSGTEFARFSAKNRWKFGHVGFCCCQRVRGGHIHLISIFFLAFWDDRRWSNVTIHIDVFGQHCGCQAFVLFHGCQKCLVTEIWWSTSSFFICEVCIAWFELLEPSFKLAFADCSIPKKFVTIAKWLCWVLTFLEVIEHNMANMDMIFELHFH